MKKTRARPVKTRVATKPPKQHYGNKAIRAKNKTLEKLRKIR